MSEDKFRQLLPHFVKSYERLYGKTIDERISSVAMSANAPPSRAWETVRELSLA